MRRPLLVLRHRAFPPLRRQRKSASALETTSTELESIFPDVLLVWKELSCPSRLFETDVVRPSERCHSAAQRLLSDLQKHLAATSPEAASFPPPPLPSPPPSPLLQLLSSLFFFVSSNDKHMWTVSTSCCQAKGLCCFSL